MKPKLSHIFVGGSKLGSKLLTPSFQTVYSLLKNGLSMLFVNQECLARCSDGYMMFGEVLQCELHWNRSVGLRLLANWSKVTVELSHVLQHA